MLLCCNQSQQLNNIQRGRDVVIHDAGCFAIRGEQTAGHIHVHLTYFIDQQRFVIVRVLRQIENSEEQIDYVPQIAR